MYHEGVIKEVELHLTMGESIVHAVLGPLSPVGRDTWTTDKKSYVPKVWALTQLFALLPKIISLLFELTWASLKGPQPHLTH